eukprot:UN02126
MIKIIVSLFALYALELSVGNRLLLQASPPVPGTYVPPWVPPTLPVTPAAHPSVLECTLPNTDPAGCAGRATKMLNPPNNFVMECSARGACAQAQITFNFVGSAAERVEQVSFSEDYAGYRATVTIDSTQSAVKQYIDKFECKAFSACLETTVVLIGGAEINDVECPESVFCANCFIKECVWDIAGGLVCDVPKPCFGY